MGSGDRLHYIYVQWRPITCRRGYILLPFNTDWHVCNVTSCSWRLSRGEGVLTWTVRDTATPPGWGGVQKCGTLLRFQISYFSIRTDMTGWSGFDARRGLGIFLFSTASRRALGPTQHPIQWVPVAPSPEVKWPGREADHSPPPSAEVKECVEL
jgi:hypothetical protein